MEFNGNWTQILLWVSGLSLLAAIATLVTVPWVVARLPSDYFCRPKRVVWRLSPDAPLLALVVGTVKNIVGLVLVMLGLVMLVTPGQGLLTLFIGLMLMNFPGKYQLERRLAAQPGVMRAMNWVRQRAGQPDFEPPAVDSVPE